MAELRVIDGNGHVPDEQAPGEVTLLDLYREVCELRGYVRAVTRQMEGNTA